jgi:hypothetical protein
MWGIIGDFMGFGKNLRTFKVFGLWIDKSAFLWYIVPSLKPFGVAWEASVKAGAVA